MAFMAKQNPASQVTGLIHSEELYNELTFETLNKGYLTLTDKQKSELDFFKKNNFDLLKKKSVFNVISNRACDKLKAQIFTVGLPKAPLSESAKASRNVMEMMYVTDIMNYLAQKKYELQDDSVHASMLTLSFENADKGQLSDSIQELRLFYHQIKDFFRKTLAKTLEKDKNYYLGTFPSIEITINKEHLAKHNSKAIWHAHLHILIYTTKELEVKSVHGKIWNKYSSLCKKAGIYASERAFLLENAYLKVDGNKNYKQFFENSMQKRDMIRQATAEASKYVMKPSTVNLFAQKNKGKFDDFRLKCFAELYSAFTKPSISEKCPYLNKKILKKRLGEKVRFDPSGLFKTARQTFNALKNVGLDGIFLFQKAHGDLSKVPTFFTQHLRILFNDYKENLESQSGYTYYSDITHQDTLSLAEMIYYNRDFLAGTLFPSKKAVKELIKKNQRYKFDLDLQKTQKIAMTNKQKVLFDVLINFASMKTSKSEVIEVFNDWIETVKNSIDRDGNFDKKRVADLRDVRNAYSEAISASSKYFKNVRIFRNFEVAKKITSLVKNSSFKPFITADSPLVFKNDKYKDFAVFSVENKGKFYCSSYKKTFSIADVKKFKDYRKKMGDEFCVTAETKDLIPVIFAYVRLRGFDDLHLSENSFDQGIDTWEFWTQGNGCVEELSMLVDCLEYALIPNFELEQRIMTWHSTELNVDLTISYDHMDKIIDNLYELNKTTHNSAFKDFDIKTDEFLVDVEQKSKDDRIEFQTVSSIKALIEGKMNKILAV